MGLREIAPQAVQGYAAAQVAMDADGNEEADQRGDASDPEPQFSGSTSIEAQNKADYEYTESYPRYTIRDAFEAGDPLI
jgi:hypothetical protein